MLELPGALIILNVGCKWMYYKHSLNHKILCATIIHSLNQISLLSLSFACVHIYNNILHYTLTNPMENTVFQSKSFLLTIMSYVC